MGPQKLWITLMSLKQWQEQGTVEDSSDRAENKSKKEAQIMKNGWLCETPSRSINTSRAALATPDTVQRQVEGEPDTKTSNQLVPATSSPSPWSLPPFLLGNMVLRATNMPAKQNRSLWSALMAAKRNEQTNCKCFKISGNLFFNFPPLV